MIISKKNEVYLTVETDKGIARELSDFFTCGMESYVCSSKDTILQSGEIYFGLLPYIEEFAKRNEIEIEYKEGVKDGEQPRDGNGWICWKSVTSVQRKDFGDS